MKKNRLKKSIEFLTKWISRLLSLFVGLLILFLLGLQFPYIQTHLAKYASKEFEKKTGYEISVDKVQINWFDLITIKRISLKDKKGATLVNLKKINIDYSLKDLLFSKEISIEEINLYNGAINLKQDDSLNFVKLFTKFKPKKKASKSKLFILQKASINNVSISYERLGREKVIDQFDPNHLYFKDLSTEITDLIIINDTVSLNIQSLSTIEQNANFNIHSLETQFLYCNKAIALKSLDAKMENSTIKNEIVFHYDSPQDLSDFINKVKIEASLDSTSIKLSDLSKIVSLNSEIEDTYLLSGRISGTVTDLAGKEIKINFGNKSWAETNLSFLGLPKINETFVDIEIKDSYLLFNDLKQYLPPKSRATFKKLGKIKCKANYIGFLNDFATSGSFKTDLGDIVTDINFKTSTNYYKGYIKTEDFDIGYLTGQSKYVNKTSLEGNIEGNGFFLNTADFVITASVEKLDFKNYEYNNITLKNAHLRKQQFNGEIAVNDKNLKLFLKGNINFKDSTFLFNSNIDTLNAYELNFSKKPLFVHSQIEANFNGLSLDKAQGVISLENTLIDYNNETLQVDSLTIASFDTNTEKTIDIYSDLFDLKAKGEFKTSYLIDESFAFYQKFGSMLHLVNQDSIDQKDPTEDDIRFKLDCTFKRGNKVLRLFDKHIYISENTKVKASLIKNSDENSLSVSLDADSIFYKYNTFEKNEFKLFANDYSQNEEDFSLEFLIKSESQSIGKIETKDLKLYAYNLDNNFILNGYIETAERKDFFNLDGYLNINENNIELGLPKTTFGVLDQKWFNKNNSANKIIFEENSFSFNDLSFATDQGQEITIDGKLLDTESDPLNINIKNFDLNALSPYINKKLNGNLDLQANLVKSKSGIRANSNGIASQLTIDNYPLGNLIIDTNWNPEKELLDINTFLEQEQKNVIQLTGSYNPNNENKSKRLSLDLIFDGVDLSTFEPFTNTFISNMQGLTIGYLEISGDLSSPIITGDALIYGGQLTVNYLNTEFHFNDKLYFYEDRIVTKNFRLADQYSHYAYLDGGLYHSEFANFIIDLTGKFKNFQVLNTTKEDNDLYYGEVISTGSFEIFGPTNDLDLDINAKTEKDTRFSIPISGNSTVSDNDFIHFVSSDTLNISPENQATDLSSNLSLDMNLDITPDAYFELIFDEQTGDIIRGNAEGKLQMGIDTKGEFTMHGDVKLTKGAYNFTLLNVVDKRFDIMRGSHINWLGDPYGAIMDIKASYQQYASLAPIIINADSALLNQPEIRRKYPVSVILNLTGSLLSPELNFDIDVLDYPGTISVGGTPISLEYQIEAFKQDIQNDEQELNKQVFSLIILKKLSPRRSFAGISNTAGSSVSEFLTNQLSYWVSQIDKNLEIDLGLGSFDRDALNTFQLRLSYSFLDGRIKVTREGGFTNTHNEADVNSILGDITVEYLLTNDGKLRAKMYQKNNSSLINSGFNNAATRGFSIQHSESFNSLKDIFRRKKKKKEKKKREKEKKSN